MNPAVPDADAPPPSASIGSAMRALFWAAVVLAASAALLRATDAIPGLVRDTARGVVRYRDIAEVERVIGRTLPSPSYYPSALEWPPGDLRVAFGSAAAYWCRGREDGSLALVIATTPLGQGDLAARVLPPATALQEADGTVGGRAARVARLRDESGALWQQVAWTGTRSVIVARSRGTLEDLMRIVSSLKE